MTWRTIIFPLFFIFTSLQAGTLNASEALSIRAKRLHDDIIVVDGHVHLITSVFNLGFDPWKVQPFGTFDYARAKQGGLDVAIEQLYTDDAYNNYNYTVKHTFRLIETFYEILDANLDKMALALTSQDVRRIVAEGKLAVILALEGGMDMEGDLDILRMYYRLGVRMIQLTSHSTTNALVDSAYDEHQIWNGLSEQGRAVIREMNRLGIIIDISHASDKAKSEIIAVSRTPVVTSHNGLQHFSSGRGNMTDQQVQALAAKGGLLGLHAAGWFLSQASLEWGYHRPRTAPPPPGMDRFKVILTREPMDYTREYVNNLDALMRDKWKTFYGYGEPWRERQREAEAAGAPLATVGDYANEIDYVVNLVGPEHVALGMDLMAGGNWLKDFDATAYPLITEALLMKGHSDDEIREIMGGNWLRMLDAAKAP